MEKEDDVSTVLFMSSYPPRECGIATFTRDLTDAVDKQHAGKLQTKILALNDNENKYDYPAKVKYDVTVSDYDDWMNVADKINNDLSVGAISIQHEFGIFCGENSCHPLPFLDKIQRPSIITFHSVFPKPQEEAFYQIRSLAKRAKGFVVMTDRAVKILRGDYGITIPIYVIPHGIPEVDFEGQDEYKRGLGLSGRRVLTSFGLVGPGKGYEHVISSLPKVVEKFPDVIYMIVGETHPGVKEARGESYRKFLEKKIRKLGIEKNVGFVNRYLPLKEVVEHLKATDVYISSGQNPEQITSGTLVYAMGCGRAVISTPFPHALDIVKEKNGLIVDFDNVDEYSQAISELLSEPERLKVLGKNNYEETRKMLWKNVAAQYGEIFSNLM